MDMIRVAEPLFCCEAAFLGVEWRLSVMIKFNNSDGQTQQVWQWLWLDFEGSRENQGRSRRKEARNPRKAEEIIAHQIISCLFARFRTCRAPFVGARLFFVRAGENFYEIKDLVKCQTNLKK